jgi:hypothetical protein
VCSQVGLGDEDEGGGAVGEGGGVGGGDGTVSLEGGAERARFGFVELGVVRFVLDGEMIDVGVDEVMN